MSGSDRFVFSLSFLLSFSPKVLFRFDFASWPISILTPRPLPCIARSRLMQNLYKYDAKFIGCRNVHKYSEEFDTGFENEIQVIFRLCSSSNCASDQCNVDGEYGQYILGVEDYMDAHEEWKENYKGMYCANELYEAAVAEESGTEYTYSDYCCEYNENCEQEEEENDFDVEKVRSSVRLLGPASMSIAISIRPNSFPPPFTFSFSPFSLF